MPSLEITRLVVVRDNAGLEPRHITLARSVMVDALLCPDAWRQQLGADDTRAPGNIPISPGTPTRRVVAVARQGSALLLAWRLPHRHSTASASARTSSGPIGDETLPSL